MFPVVGNGGCGNGYRTVICGRECITTSLYKELCSVVRWYLEINNNEKSILNGIMITMMD